MYLLQEVQPNSPADIAGLRSNTDYIIGADSVLHEVRVTILLYKLVTLVIMFNDLDVYLLLTAKDFVDILLRKNLFAPYNKNMQLRHSIL